MRSLEEIKAFNDAWCSRGEKDKRIAALEAELARGHQARAAAEAEIHRIGWFVNATTYSHQPTVEQIFTAIAELGFELDHATEWAEKTNADGSLLATAAQEFLDAELHFHSTLSGAQRVKTAETALKAALAVWREVSSK